MSPASSAKVRICIFNKCPPPLDDEELAPNLRAQVRERAASLFDDDGAVDEWARFLERAADQARRDGQSVILN